MGSGCVSVVAGSWEKREESFPRAQEGPAAAPILGCSQGACSSFYFDSLLATHNTYTSKEVAALLK